MGKRKDHEGTIRQRPNGLWEASVQLDYKRVSLYGRTQAEVLAKLAEAKRANAAGRSPLPDRSSVESFLDTWLGTVKTSTRAKTYESYECVVRRHLKPTLGPIPIAKLNARDVQALVTKLVHKKTAGAGQKSDLSPRTVEYCLLVLRRALNVAVAWNILEKNPAVAVKPPRTTRSARIYLDVAGAQKLLKAAKGDKLEALYTVAMAVGLRKGEALGLRWSDVNLDAGTLVVNNQLQRVHVHKPEDAPKEVKEIKSKLSLTEPKTSTGKRTLELPAFAVEALRAHRSQQDSDAKKAGSKWKTTGYVFTSRVGTPLEPRRVTVRFAALLTKAELPPMRFHDLRHSCATLMLAQGANPRTVMETLGHSRVTLTLDTYSHVMPSVKKEAARMMDEAITGVKPAEAATEGEPAVGSA